MGHYIGLDLGTTSITGLVLDTGSGDTLARWTVANTTETTAPSDRLVGRSEWDIDRMIGLVFEVMERLTSDETVKIDGIGITGQQHGMTLLDLQENPVGPFIGWQDRRCLEHSSSLETALSRMLRSGGEEFSRSEYLPARGYMGSTLFWMKENGFLPINAQASFAPDYLAAKLCARSPVTDPTNAAGSGLYDVFSGEWNTALLERLALPLSVLPEVHPSCSWIGSLAPDVARRIGLPSGIPIANACGDNQASFAGSVAGYGDSALINIGTGGQVSVYNERPVRIDGLLARPYLKPGYLLVGAGLTGGRAYGLFERFVQLIGDQIFGVKDTPDLFDRLNALAAQTVAGSDGLRCEPVFTGSLKEPDRRGVWQGISDANFTPGHLTRSLLEGMAEQFHLLYQAMLANGVAARTRLIGAGNGVRKNPLLSRIIADTFSLPLRIVTHSEEAAFGAALTAAVAAGEFTDIEAAGNTVIRYNAMDAPDERP